MDTKFARVNQMSIPILCDDCEAEVELDDTSTYTHCTCCRHMWCVRCAPARYYRHTDDDWCDDCCDMDDEFWKKN